MAVNINAVPTSVKMVSSLLIIIGFVDLFVKLYFRIGGMVDADEFIPYLLSLALSIGEIGCGYAIFYRKKVGYIVGWFYGLIEIVFGIISILNLFDIKPLEADSMYVANLFIGLIIVIALSRRTIIDYCFRKDTSKK